MGLTNISQSVAPPSSTATTGAPAPSGVSIIVPSYASWFSLESVHDIERRALPEFFDSQLAGGRNPSQYVGYRNFMVNMYRQRPQAYLALTTCRRHLAGDVGSIVRVHAFLEQWGLINFQVEGSGKTTGQMGSNQGVTNLKIVVPKAVDAALGASITTDSSSYGVAAGEIKCSVCSVMCTDNYFHKPEPPKRAPSLASPGPQNMSLSLCPLCYSDGRFPAELSSVDFIHIDTQSFPSLRNIPWTDKEVLGLLEAIEEQSNSGVSADKFDWDKVSQTVGRSKDQCILQFLKLPTVESLDQVPLEKISEKTTLNGFPFGQVENPVMSTVAFLASMVHPKVAAAAAHAAISELSNLSKIEKEASSKMDVDGESQTFLDATSKESLQQIAATAIGSAAARAHQLSGEEADRLQKLREVLVDLQMQKIKIKLALFEDLEKGLEEDKKDVEQQRLQLFIDRFNLRKMMLKSQQSGQVPPMHSRQPASATSNNQSGPSANGAKPVLTQL